MKVFIFEDVFKLTCNYHSGGGLVVVAKDEDGVKEIIATDKEINLTEGDWRNVVTYEIKEDVEPKMFIFPDAGCC